MVAMTIILKLGMDLARDLWQEPLPAAPAPSYVVRRVEMKLVDTRKSPDRSINPSWMEPNMRFVCTEEKP